MPGRQSINIDPQDKQQIANIIADYFKQPKLATDWLDEWFVCDHDETNDLYMVHHVDDADLNNLGLIRGVVVDILHKHVVSDSFGGTHIIHSDEIQQVNGSYDFTDVNGHSHNFKAENIIFRPCFEGALIRVFLFNGMIYTVSHRRFDMSKIRYFKSPLFSDMMKDLKMPTTEMFDTENTKYSPNVYFFLLVHPTLLQTTKENVGDGFVIDLGHKTMWNIDNCPFSIRDMDGKNLNPDKSLVDVGSVEMTPRISSRRCSEIPVVIDEPILYCPARLNDEQCNYYLKHGYYSPIDNPPDDVRVLPSESVIGYCYNDDGSFNRLLKINSTACMWRCAIRGTSANLLHRFYELTKFANFKVDANKNISPDDLEEFLQMFPVFVKIPTKQVKELISKQHLMFYPVTDKTDNISTRNNLMYIIWISLIISAPVHCQAEIAEYLDEYYATRERIVTWLIKLALLNDLDLEHRLDLMKKNKINVTRVVSIVKLAKSSSFERYQTNLSNGRNNVTHASLIRTSISNMIRKEKGTSLYALRKSQLADSKLEVEI